MKTLSMRTRDTPDAVFRGWASARGSSSGGGESSFDIPSTLNSLRTYTFSGTGEAINSAADSSSSRPSLAASPSVSFGGGELIPRTRTRGEKKHRVVKPRPSEESLHAHPMPNRSNTLSKQTTATSSTDQKAETC
ncbi:hypothetical protein HOY82DRAFT_547993 [Tuber indicum]|nr:hypothetical protein HOY82DRAFT_547993 [Tuber indicum]